MHCTFILKKKYEDKIGLFSFCKLPVKTKYPKSVQVLSKRLYDSV